MEAQRVRLSVCFREPAAGVESSVKPDSDTITDSKIAEVFNGCRTG
jgi:hypothetical protein